MDGRLDPGAGAARAPLAPTARDWGVAALIALAAGVLYALTFQTRWFGDGPGLARMHASGSTGYYHLLYLPACDVLEGAFGLADPFGALRLLSILPAALGAGLVYLVARACAAPPIGALLALALLVLAPSLWFFGTTVEIHTLHFGTVALVALLTLLAPWRRPRLALALVALAFPLLYWTHQAAFTLGPGWVLLVQFARARHGTRFSWKGLVFGVGPALLGALLAGVLVSYLVRLGSLAAVWQDVREQLELQSGQANLLATRPVWRDEWLLPLGVLVPLAALGLASLRRERLLLATLSVLVLVPTAFFLWWGVYEMGGYFLGSAPFVVVAVARLFGRGGRASLALALVLVVVQGAFGWSRLRAYDQGFDPAKRTELVRAALGERGLLVTTTDAVPSIEYSLPDVKQVSLIGLISAACQQERALLSSEQMVEHARRMLAPRFRRNERIALELGYKRRSGEEEIPEFRLGLEAIERDLRARYEVREIDDPYWPLLVLERLR